ncbi:MAG: hypothetical protein R2751_09725 [Bacteroidales bacterium]
MTTNIKQRLLDAGAEALADALLELARFDANAEQIVSRLTRTKEEAIAQYKKNVADLKRQTRTISREESMKFAYRLESILFDLQTIDPEACLGLTLVASFFETDKAIAGKCDGSWDMIREVYRYQASRMFASYAGHCDDKRQVRKILIKLYLDDAHSAREMLFSQAPGFLGEKETRNALREFQEVAQQERDEPRRAKLLRTIESLAITS